MDIVQRKIDMSKPRSPLERDRLLSEATTDPVLHLLSVHQLVVDEDLIGPRPYTDVVSNPFLDFTVGAGLNPLPNLSHLIVVDEIVQRPKPPA